VGVVRESRVSVCLGENFDWTVDVEGIEVGIDWDEDFKWFWSGAGCVGKERHYC
jgi:hypothetical protein